MTSINTPHICIIDPLNCFSWLLCLYVLFTCSLCSSPSPHPEMWKLVTSCWLSWVRLNWPTLALPPLPHLPTPLWEHLTGQYTQEDIDTWKGTTQDYISWEDQHELEYILFFDNTFPHSYNYFSTLRCSPAVTALTLAHQMPDVILALWIFL